MATRSPFPGMDPWLERYWGDVHNSLITYSRDQLQDQLQADLVARMEERVYLEEPAPAPSQAFRPDVQVVETPLTYEPRRSGRTSGVMTALAEPMLVHIDPIEVTETFIQIIDRDEGGRVITIIGFLSPGNKLPGEGRTKYLQKQKQVRKSNTNLVEIDLLRTGEPTTLFGERPIPVDERAAYHACVLRTNHKERLEYYPLPLRQSLPTIRIPLRPKDHDIGLNLQALIDQAYDKGRYARINYNQSPRPPLATPDATWAAEVVRSNTSRQ